jgi:hypothetical protein
MKHEGSLRQRREWWFACGDRGWFRQERRAVQSYMLQLRSRDGVRLEQVMCKR